MRGKRFGGTVLKNHDGAVHFGISLRCQDEVRYQPDLVSLEVPPAAGM